MHHTVGIIPHLNAAAFQTISEEKWKARRRVIYRVLLASDLALALTASNDISHSLSKVAVMLLGGRKREKRELLSEDINGCNLNFCKYLGVVEWGQLQPSDLILKCFHICVSTQVQPSHFMLRKWPVSVTHSYCFINRAQTSPVLLEMQRTISSLE